MKRKYFIKLFIMGCLAFTISQILLRIPLLNFLGSKIFWIKFINEHYLLYGIILSLSAGIFEETSRFICRNKFIKNDKNIIEPVVFGLGHGLVEVFYLLIIIITSEMFISKQNLVVGIYERILTIAFHITLTILIWNGFLKGKKWTYLSLAILFHGFFDFLIFLFRPIFIEFGSDFYTLVLYGSSTVFVTILSIVVVKKGKILRRIFNEKI